MTYLWSIITFFSSSIHAWTRVRVCVRVCVIVWECVWECLRESERMWESENTQNKTCNIDVSLTSPTVSKWSKICSGQSSTLTWQTLPFYFVLIGNNFSHFQAIKKTIPKWFKLETIQVDCSFVFWFLKP